MKRIVVVGASLAGLRAVEALRRLGFDGDIVWLGDEVHAPYDRPPLSKELLKGTFTPERLALRKDGYEDLRVERRVLRATGLDLAANAVLCGDERIPFDGLVIATGASARALPDAPAGVHVLRTLDDGLRLREALEARPRLVVVGAGFIGSEVASSARALELDVSLVETLAVPLSDKLGTAMGEVCATLHREHGVALHTGVKVLGFEGDGRVRGVRLSDGRTLPAECVVVGIGVRPNVAWLEGTGLDLQDGVLCDAACRVRDARGEPLSHVVAAGDVCRFHNPLFDETMRVEHWTHAVEQAEHAAQTLLGEAKPFATSPLFWSDQYGIKIQFTGRARPGDQLHVAHGSAAEKRFVALYGREGRLVGALAFRRPAQLVRYRGLIEQQSSFEAAVQSAG